jgi:Uma2 family endonuclease
MAKRIYCKEAPNLELLVTLDKYKDKLLEYYDQHLLITGLATGIRSSSEAVESIGQAHNWHCTSKGMKAGGLLSNDCGYRFNADVFLIPDLSYINKRTWTSLTPEEKQMAFTPCIPQVVIDFKSSTDYIEERKNKMKLYMDFGVLEGILGILYFCSNFCSKVRKVHIFLNF